MFDADELGHIDVIRQDIEKNLNQKVEFIKKLEDGTYLYRNENGEFIKTKEEMYGRKTSWRVINRLPDKTANSSRDNNI